MGQIIERRIDYIRTWVDPSQPEEEVPDLDSKIILPRTVYDAVQRTDDPNAPTLTQDIASINAAIASKQPKIGGGEAGKVMTWTGEEGVIGSAEVVKVINPDDTAQSYAKLASERAVGNALAVKANKTELQNHVNDLDVHVTPEDKERWNSNVDGEAFREHIENEDIHVTAEDKANWNNKPTGSAFNSHVNNVNNPHNVSAHQVGSYTIAEIDDMFQSLRESFFNYRNIYYDDRTGIATLEEYDEDNWNPNYVLSYGSDLPTPTDDSLTYFAIRPVSDYSTHETNQAIIYIKKPGYAWVEAGLADMEAGDMVIRYPDATMCVWIQGRFVAIYTSSSPDEGGGGGGSSDLMWRPVVSSDGVLTFVRSAESTPPDPVNIKGPAGYTPQKGIDYNDGANGVGIPEGGNDGEVVVKVSGTDYDTEWMTIAELFDRYVSAGDIPQLLTDYNNLTNAPKVYNFLGENEDAVVTQKAITSKFNSVDNAIEQINNIIGGSGGTGGISERLNNHLLDYQNPHRVTPSQIGAVSTATFLEHSGNTNNPHRVTAAQLGLGEVNNTSDLNKPISLLQQQAFDEVNRQIQEILESIGGDDRITTIDWDPTTLTLTFYKVNSDPQVVRIPLIDIFNGMSWDTDHNELVFPLPDGTSKRVPIDNLITEYTGARGTNIETKVRDDGRITATIIPSTITGDDLVQNINLRGMPTTTTQAAGDNSNKIATTAFVKRQIVDDLNSSDSSLALSANMGKHLMENKASIQDVIDIIDQTPMMNVVDNLTSTDTAASLSANMGRQLNLIKADKVHTSSSGATYGRASVNLFGHARAGDVDPLMDGEAEVGTDDGYFARSDHRHPVDTSRAPLHWPDGSIFRMTGEFRAETPPWEADDDRVATCEWVLRQDPSHSHQIIQAHINDHQNPHNVTAAQVGLGNVDNTSDENKALSRAARQAFSETNNRVTDLENGKADSSTVSSLADRVENLETNSATKTELGSVSDRVGDLETNSATKTELSGVSDRVGTLETDSATKTELSGVSDRVNNLETNSATKTELGAVSDRVGTLETDSATKSEVETLSGRINSLENNSATINALNHVSGRVTNLENNSATKTELNQLDNELDAQVEALNTRISDLTNIDNMKDEISEDVTDNIIDVILNSISNVGTDAVFNLAGSNLSLHYNESMGIPDMEIDENGDLILTSTDQAIDDEIELYSFAIEGYDLVLTKEES